MNCLVICIVSSVLGLVFRVLNLSNSVNLLVVDCCVRFGLLTFIIMVRRSISLIEILHV